MLHMMWVFEDFDSGFNMRTSLNHRTIFEENKKIGVSSSVMIKLSLLLNRSKCVSVSKSHLHA